MKSPSRIRSAQWLSSLLLMAASGQAGAVDIVPMAGFRFGGDVSSTTTTSGTSTSSTSQSFTIDSSASYGGAIDFPLPSDFPVQAVEIYYSRQQTTLQSGALLSPPVSDLDVSVLQLGVVAVVPTENQRLSWLVTATFGAARFETSGGSETRPSIGAGGAVRWMANDHVGVRADLRVLVDFTSSGGSILACNNGSCNYNYIGTVIVQGEASVGIVLRF